MRPNVGATRPETATIMPTPHVLVALATFNEIENLPSLVDSILKELPQADVLVVDDNSPDGTGAWCDQRSAHDQHVRCIHRPAKLGLGTAALAAMRYALENQYDVLVTLDADWSHDPSYLTQLTRAIQTADVAIGSRYCSGAGIQGWPWRRRLASRVMNRLSRAILHLPVRDSSGAFRAYRVSKLRELDLSAMRADGYAYLEEIVWHLDRHGATFVEVPITFYERRAGQSKINLGEATSKIRTLLRLASQHG